MPSKTAFHVFIPCLLKSLKSWHQDFLFEAFAPHLSVFLTQYSSQRTTQTQSLNEAFFKLLGTKEKPTAIYRHKVQLNSYRDALICADPIHLEVAMNDVTLTKKISDLSDEEAKELIALLNKTFKEDGIKFIFGSNQYWYASLPDKEIVESYDIDTVFLENIMGKQPQSNQRNWHVLQNEIQMLLHNSDVNRRREIAALKPVNSLWFWGAGHQIEAQVEIDTIYSSEETASKLTGQLFAQAANCEWQKMPDNTDSLIEQTINSDSKQILLLEQLFIPAIHNNLDEFQKQLTLLDEHYFKPLLFAWQKEQIEIVIDSCDGNVLTPQKVPSWKFWRKPKSLREITDEAD